MKTKILSLVMVVMLLLAATACTPKATDESSAEPELPSPETVLADFVAAMNDGDYEKAGEFTTDVDYIVDGMKEIEDLEGNEFAEMGADILKKILASAKIEEVGEAEIDGDTATLEATISAPDFIAIIEDITEKYSNMSDEDAQEYISKLEDPTDVEAMTALLMDDMMKDIEEALEDKNGARAEEEVTVAFEKGEEAWLIDVDEIDELLSALMAGIDEAA